ncbi:CD63 antigen-like isoform X2 [Belonocnema kinseyi]|uniref:CD63 antigen-like isoform X2 n=1 Tax=Belonocnema kinseyi TaxID=2817044 RepID=UPI00143DBF55|nr:CD63 antigen-like isoform X2 [Belonocnema kinseyi]
MTCVSSCIKYLLFIFNFLFAVCGLAIVTVGVIFHLQVKDVSDALKDQGIPPAIPIGLIVIGAVIFLIAFFGCCGAIRDSHCMVVTFAVFLLAILIIQVAIAVYAYMQKIDSNKIQNTYRNDVFMKYYDESSNVSKNIVDSIQSVLHCCGADSPRDYNQFARNTSIPSTCCNNPTDVACDPYGQGEHKVFSEGCGVKVAHMFEKALKTLAGVAIGVAVVELLGIIFSLCLANAIRNDERRGYRV